MGMDGELWECVSDGRISLGFAIYLPGLVVFFFVGATFLRGLELQVAILRFEALVRFESMLWRWLRLVE